MKKTPTSLNSGTEQSLLCLLFQSTCVTETTNNGQSAALCESTKFIIIQPNDLGANLSSCLGRFYCCPGSGLRRNWLLPLWRTKLILRWLSPARG